MFKEKKNQTNDSVCKSKKLIPVPRTSQPSPEADDSAGMAGKKTKQA